ncbi:MAG: hypothetical protein ACK559_12345, partial [bacterium]
MAPAASSCTRSRPASRGSRSRATRPVAGTTSAPRARPATRPSSAASEGLGSAGLLGLQRLLRLELDDHAPLGGARVRGRRRRERG